MLIVNIQSCTLITSKKQSKKVLGRKVDSSCLPFYFVDCSENENPYKHSVMFENVRGLTIE